VGHEARMGEPITTCNTKLMVRTSIITPHFVKEIMFKIINVMMSTLKTHEQHCNKYIVSKKLTLSSGVPF
jgi:hypothetical protein